MTVCCARVPLIFGDGETGVGERVVITPLACGFEDDLRSACLLRVELRVLVGVVFFVALLVDAGALIVVNAGAALHLFLRYRMLSKEYVLLLAGERSREDPTLLALDGNFDGLGYGLGVDVLPFCCIRFGVT